MRGLLFALFVDLLFLHYESREKRLRRSQMFAKCSSPPFVYLQCFLNSPAKCEIRCKIVTQAFNIFHFSPAVDLNSLLHYLIDSISRAMEQYLLSTRLDPTSRQLLFQGINLRKKDFSFYLNDSNG